MTIAEGVWPIGRISSRSFKGEVDLFWWHAKRLILGMEELLKIELGNKKTCDHY